MLREPLKIIAMPPKAKTMRPKTPRERMRARRTRLRVQGLRPVQHWVPDLRDPRVRADLLRQGNLLAQHPENAAIDAWIDAAYDWDEWK
jgi:antidote-toxin recognition MazE-like antitoxin